MFPPNSQFIALAKRADGTRIVKERNPYFELHELGHKTNTLPVFPGLKSKVKSQIMRGFPEVKGIICIGDHIIERTKGAHLRISTGDGVYRK